MWMPPTHLSTYPSIFGSAQPLLEKEKSSSAILSLGGLPPGDLWQCLETFLAVTPRGGGDPGI